MQTKIRETVTRALVDIKSTRLDSRENIKRKLPSLVHLPVILFLTYVVNVGVESDLAIIRSVGHTAITLGVVSSLLLIAVILLPTEKKSE